MGGLTEAGASGTLKNVTISGNTANGPAGFGGGLRVNNGSTPPGPPATVGLVNVTIANNSAATGSGVSAGNGTAGFTNSIVAAGTGGPACDGDIRSQGGNLSSDASCSLFTGTGDGIGLDPRLDPLASNGGPTQTHALKTDSPARDRAPDCASLTTDQRGESRPTDGDGDGIAKCDSGAYEAAQVAALPGGITVTPTGGLATTEAGGQVDVHGGAHRLAHRRRHDRPLVL